MKERFNPFIVRRLKQIDDLVDEVYHEVTPCDYFDNAQLSCDEFINESEDLGDFNYTNSNDTESNRKTVTPSDLKKIEFIAEYIEGVSGEYLDKSNYKPCFVSVNVSRNKFYIVVIVTDKKYTLEGYEKFINEKLHKTFKGMDIYVLLIDNKYDDGNSIPKSCDDYFNHIPKLPNTITIEF